MVEFFPTIIFVIILISVPLQFYFSPNSTKEANYYVHRIVNKIKEYYETSFEASNLDVDEYDNINVDVDVSEQIDEIIEGRTSLKDEDVDPISKGYFGGSREPRDPRPPHVNYHVGQVITHKIHKYRAVIIAWDEKGNAPDWWSRRVHRGRTDWKEIPNYTVVVDTRDRLIPQLSYIPEDNIEPSQGTVIHPLVKHYFEKLGVDGRRYNLRPWHQRVYPHG